MQIAHVASKVLVCGRSGSGKTTFMLRYLLGLPAHVTRFIWDPEGELAQRLALAPATGPGELGICAVRRWVVYSPDRMFPGDQPRGWEFFCRWAWEAAARLPGRKVFCADELQRWTSTAKVSPGAALVLETGRRYGLDLVAATQQPNIIHNRWRNQMTEVVAFAGHDERALEPLAEWGFDVEAVRHLPDGSFIARNVKTRGQASGKVF